MNKKKIFIIISVSLLFAAGFVSAASLDNPIGYDDFSSLFYAILESVGALVASLSSVAFVISGIMYIGSTANPELRATAKKALVWAVIGTALGLSATAIVNFVKNTVG